MLSPQNQSGLVQDMEEVGYDKYKMDPLLGNGEGSRRKPIPEVPKSTKAEPATASQNHWRLHKDTNKNSKEDAKQ